MIFVSLTNGSSLLVKLEEIRLVKSHGNKTLIFTYASQEPFCASTSIDELYNLIQNAIEKRTYVEKY